MNPAALLLLASLLLATACSSRDPQPPTGFAELSASQAKPGVPPTVVAAVIRHLEVIGEDPNDYWIGANQDVVEPGAVSVSLWYRADSDDGDSLGNESGKSRNLWVSVRDGKIVREAYWQ
jgi:hypothetical protein